MLLQTITKFLYAWEVRLGVILSMSIQIILFFFGSRRKISEAISLKILLWIAYVSADAVAIFSLGLLAQHRGEKLKEEPLQNHQLHLLWVPFLILHLGGPDTITAYSLEDNKLWLRHLLSLVIQVGVALYAIIKSWNSHDPLAYLVIPVFILGVFKYCERIWALKSATFKQIFIRFASKCSYDPKDTHFDKVSWFLSTLTHFFVDSLPPFDYHRIHAAHNILMKNSQEAFKVVEIETGLLYDLLYTKALLSYSWLGICLRCVYLVTSIAAMTIFAITHKHNDAKWSYPLWDVLVTYFVMIGAVVLEIYAIVSVVFSDWALIWLDRHQNDNAHAKSLFQVIHTCSRVLFGEKRWSRRLKQYNILRSLALAPHENRRRIRDVSPFSLLPWQDIDVFLEKDVNKTSEFDMFSGDDDDDGGVNEMRKLIFVVIVDSLKIYEAKLSGGHMNFTEFLRSLIDETLKRNDLETDPRRFKHTQRLFIWHIATTLCYYSDERKGVPGGNAADRKVRSNCNASRYVSDYLLYLVRFHQTMLPARNYKQVCEPLETFIRELKSSGYDCERLLVEVRQQSQLRPPFEYKYEAWLIATEGVQLAIKLQDRFDIEKRWELIVEFWIKTLVHAASHQRWEEHVQQLSRGGEFITHVAFLQAHASMICQEKVPVSLFFKM